MSQRYVFAWSSVVRRPHQLSKVHVSKWFGLLLAVFVVPSWAVAEDDATAAAVKRISNSVQYLSSDELEGRGIGTAGLDKAANFIADEFIKFGLKTDLFDGSPFQKFQLSTSPEQGPPEHNVLVLVGPPAAGSNDPRRVELKLGKDFQTLAMGGSAVFDAPLVFVGYGITAKENDLAYDDYAGLDVKGKVVVLLRKEPQQDNEQSKFNGKNPSRHAFYTTKIANAIEHGAAAILFVNDYFGLRQKTDGLEKDWRETVDKLTETRRVFLEVKEPDAEAVTKHRAEVSKLAEQIAAVAKKLNENSDDLLEFAMGFEGNSRSVPVVFCRRAAIDEVLKAAANTDLATLERDIDASPTPAPKSSEIAGWRATGETNVKVKQVEVKNVLAVLEGEGPLADETIVIGAHYDHLGRGGFGSLTLGSKEIHNGADDNASGTATLLEIAHHFATQPNKPRRRLVFIAFTGEERGLIGSRHYVRSPRFPLENTVAMVNLDMVGRLTDDKLVVYGTGTAAEFSQLMDDLNGKYGFQLTKLAETDPGTGGMSDHESFYEKKIPVFHFFTGLHRQYHRPEDDFERLNVAGMQRIAALTSDAVQSIASADKRPEYREVKRTPRVAGGERGPPRPRFGAVPDYTFSGEGCALQDIGKDSPAEKAGLKPGDIIIKLGEDTVASVQDFDTNLRKHKPGDKVATIVKRGAEKVTVTVTLEEAKR